MIARYDHFQPFGFQPCPAVNSDHSHDAFYDAHHRYDAPSRTLWVVRVYEKDLISILSLQLNRCNAKRFLRKGLTVILPDYLILFEGREKWVNSPWVLHVHLDVFSSGHIEDTLKKFTPFFRSTPQSR